MKFLFVVCFLIAALNAPAASLPRLKKSAEITVTLAAYRDFLQLAASSSDPYWLYDKTVAENGLLQAPSQEGYCYTLTPGADGAEPIYNLTRLQQERFCNWYYHKNNPTAEGPVTTEEGVYSLHGMQEEPAIKNPATTCYLKEDNTDILQEKSETIIIVPSSEELLEGQSNPMMMMEEKIPTQEAEENSLTLRESQRSQEALRTPEARRGALSGLRDITDQNSMSSKTEAAAISPEEKVALELWQQRIAEARDKTYLATIDLMGTKELLRKAEEAEKFLKSFSDIQTTVRLAYALRKNLENTTAENLQNYNHSLQGLCHAAEVTYAETKNKLKIYQQDTALIPNTQVFAEYILRAQAFVKKAEVAFEEAHRELHALKQESKILDEQPSPISSISKNNSSSNLPEIPPLISAASLDTHQLALKQQQLLLLQFNRLVEANQWHPVGKKGPTSTIEAPLLEEEKEQPITKVSSLEDALTSQKSPTPDPGATNLHSETKNSPSPTHEKEEEENDSDADSLPDIENTTSKTSEKKGTKKKRKNTKKKKTVPTTTTEPTTSESLYPEIDNLNVFQLTNQTLNDLLPELFKDIRFSGFRTEKALYKKGKKIDFFAVSPDLDFPYFKQGATNLLNERANRFLPNVLALPQFSKRRETMQAGTSPKDFDFTPTKGESEGNQQFKQAVIEMAYDSIQKDMKAKEVKAEALFEEFSKELESNSKKDSKNKATDKNKK